MPLRTIIETMDALAVYLDAFEAATRTAHGRYRAFSAADLLDLDSRAQAACTYSFGFAELHSRLTARDGVRLVEYRGLKTWLIEPANAVVRLKKMDEDGRTRNYPTRQARACDAGKALPGLPMPPVRLTVGYLLDATGTAFKRTQVARPFGREILWCAAVIPTERRRSGERSWTDVTRQYRL